MKFTACEHLDFSDNYHNCKKQELASGKLFWLRDVSYDPTLPAMVQFCKLCGRLNNPEACTTAEHARCSYYKEFEHDIAYIEEE